MTQDEKHAVYIAWRMGAHIQYRWTDGRLGPAGWRSYTNAPMAPIEESGIYWWAHGMHDAHITLEFRIAPKE